MLPRGWVLMGTNRPDEPRLIGDSEEIRRFREAVCARIQRVAVEAGGDLREIPPAVLLSLLCASAFSAVAGETAGAPTLGLLSSRAVLGDLISAAIHVVRASSQRNPPSPHDLEQEIYWRIEHALAVQDENAAVLRAEIAEVLAETSALSGATESGNDRLRNDVISAIDTLSSGYPEMAFLVRAGDHEAAQMQRRLDEQGAEFRVLSEAIGRQDSGCPYRGLLPFDQDHAEVFFGRQRLTAELVLKLAGRLAGPSMVVVSGASGAGKSSLLRAGLLPALAAGIELEGSDGWPRIVMTPTGDPLTELANRLARLSHGDAAAIGHGLAADPDQAHLVVGQAVLDGITRGHGSWPPAAARPGRLVLAVDQFEEVFTLAPSRDAGQQAFIAALCAAASQPFGPRGEPAAVVVIAVRGDFWARCVAHAGLARLMQDGMFVVGPMTGTELREAITGPAAAAGLQVDADLADTILADLRTAGQDEAEGILPLVSQSMMLTWQRRDGNRLTVQGYHESGGVARSVEFGAEAVYEALPDAGQQTAREVFRALVLVGPDGQLARRAAPRAELAAGRRQAARRALGTVLEAFASSRLLVLDGDTVQIAHDVLLRAWPRLRGWLDSEQANWVLYTQLQEDAAGWAGHGRDSSFLYRGSQLVAVEQVSARWAADPARYPALTDDQSRFLAGSRQHAARGARVRRAAVLALALLLIISVAAAGLAARADRTANQQRDTAVSAQLADRSEALDATDPVDAAQLAAAAWRIAPTPEAQTSLLDVLAQPTRQVITAAGFISGVAFSPDGKRFAAAGYGFVQVWDTATGREIGRPLNIGDGNASVAFRRDGDVIAVSSNAPGPSQLWNVTTRSKIGAPIAVGNDPFIFNPGGTLLAIARQPRGGTLLDLATLQPIRSYPGGAEPLAFSPDGKILAIALGNGNYQPYDNYQLYDLASRRVIRTLPGTTGSCCMAAFSPDSKIIATTTKNSVTLWDVATGRRLGSPIPVSADSLSFSPDGQTLAIMGPAGATLWNTATHQQLGGVLTPRNSGFLVFSPDNTTLAWVNAGVVSLLNVDADRQIGAAIGFDGPPAAVAFSPDGKLLGVADGGVSLWSAATRRRIATLNSSSGDEALTVAFSPDGKIVASSGTVDTSLWTVATRRLIGAPNPDRSGQADGLAFDPRGTFLAIGVDGGKAWLWDLAAGRVHGRPMIYGSNAIAFSPDGTLLATAGGDARLFSVATQDEIGKPFAAGGVYDVAFSPDGGTLATGAPDGVTLWNVATQRQIGAPLNATTVQAVAFSPDGELLATASKDGTIRLFDVASHEQVGSVLSTDSSAVQSIAFSPDGSLIATASEDGTVRIWDAVPTGDLLARVCALAGGSLTRQQWNSYVSSVGYEQSCA